MATAINTRARRLLLKPFLAPVRGAGAWAIEQARARVHRAPARQVRRHEEEWIKCRPEHTDERARDFKNWATWHLALDGVDDIAAPTDRVVVFGAGACGRAAQGAVWVSARK